MNVRTSQVVWVFVIASALSSCDQPKLASVPTRDVLAAGQLPASGYGAYGYVVFTKRPPVIQLSREEAFCTAYVSGLEPASSYRSIPKANLMPTYWLLEAGRAHASSCESLLTGYDYARAKTIASTVSKLDAIGPLLVAWRVPFEQAEGQEALVLDLSKIRQDQFTEAVGTWSSRITRTPDLWATGFNVEKIRLEFKSFLNEYGDSVVSVIEWFKAVAS